MDKKPQIAVNARFLIDGKIEGMGRFSYEILSRLVKNHPEVQFHFFFDRPYHERFIFGENVTPHVLFPPARHPILFYLYFEWAIARKLKQLQPDAFFSPDGFLSLRSDVPQVPVFHDLAFMHFPEDVKKSEAWFYHKFWPKYAEKAAHILAVSEYTKSDITKQFGTEKDKISVVYNASSSGFQPVSEAVKEATRKKFTAGKRYLHFVGAIHPRKNILTLLKAFNKFRNESSADVKLLLVGRKGWHFDEVIHIWESSMYREDIVFTGYVRNEDLNAIYGSSEGLVYIPYFEGFGLPIVEAMNTDTPVICSNVTSMPEVAGNAALTVDPNDVEGVASAMKDLIENREIRESLIHRGNQRKTHFSWEESASRVWGVLEKFLA